MRWPDCPQQAQRLLSARRRRSSGLRGPVGENHPPPWGQRQRQGGWPEGGWEVGDAAAAAAAVAPAAAGAEDDP